MKSPERIQEKGSGTGVEKWVSYDTAVEEHEAVMQRQQKEEEMMAAGLVEMNRDKTQDWAQGKDSEFKWEEWDRESVVEEDGSAREAFEPRGSKGLECQRDGEEEGGKERQEEGGKEGQDEGEEGGKEAFRRQDDDGNDEKQVGRGKVVRPQCEEDKQQGCWSTDVWKGDEDEKRVEMGKGSDNSGERMNLEDFSGGSSRHKGNNSNSNKAAEMRVGRKMAVVNKGKRYEKERLRGGIGQGKGMRKGQGKGKGEIDEQKDWEERWRVKKDSWMNDSRGE